MAYNSENQYRCTIIKGKAQNQLEDLLPVYARIVLDCSGFERDAFINVFCEPIAYVYEFKVCSALEEW